MTDGAADCALERSICAFCTKWRTPFFKSAAVSTSENCACRSLLFKCAPI